MVLDNLREDPDPFFDHVRSQRRVAQKETRLRGTCLVVGADRVDRHPPFSTCAPNRGRLLGRYFIEPNDDVNARVRSFDTRTGARIATRANKPGRAKMFSRRPL